MIFVFILKVLGISFFLLIKDNLGEQLIKKILELFLLIIQGLKENILIFF